MNRKIFLWTLIFVSVTIRTGLSQYPLVLVGDEVHSVGSTVECTFSIPITDLTTYELEWRFNSTNVCRVTVQLQTVQNKVCHDSSRTGYYNNNSQIVSAIYADSTLKIVYSYQNIKSEDGPLMLSVIEQLTGTFYNDTKLTVEYCPEQKNTDHEIIGSCADQYNYFNCTSSFRCSGPYEGEDIIATCQSDATWSNYSECNPKTTTTTTTTSTAPSTSASKAEKDVKGPEKDAMISIGVIGGAALIVFIVLAVVYWNKFPKSPPKYMLLLPGGISTFFWALGLGLLGGLGEAGRDTMTNGQIAGCVLGGIATVGLIGSCVFIGLKGNAGEG